MGYCRTVTAGHSSPYCNFMNKCSAELRVQSINERSEKARGMNPSGKEPVGISLEHMRNQ